jgi:hypothetical protein
LAVPPFALADCVALPNRQPYVRLGVLSEFGDDFGRRLASGGEVQLVLHDLEELGRVRS